MRETIIQLTMLCLAAVSCYGWFRRMEKLFSLRAEFAVFIGFSAIGLAMLLAAVSHLLQPAIYLIFGLGLLLALYSVFCRESLRDFLQPGVIFLLLCCGAFFVLLYGSKLTHVDNFSHWGAILKMIIQRGALPENETLVYFPAYPTGSSLLIYYFVCIVGIEAEWFWAYIQAVYLSSCAATLFCFGEEKSRAGAITGFVFTALMALCLICGNIEICDLLVDTLVPMIALAGTAMCICYRNEYGKKVLPLIIATAFLPMVKNSGYLFSVVLIVFALCLSKGRDKLRLPLLMGGSLFAVNRIWSWHVNKAFEGGMSSYHAMSAESLGGGFAEKSSENLVNISRAFLDALLREGRLLWLLALLLAVILMLHKCGKWREFRGFILAGILVWLGWTVGMLAMYFSSMSVGEALGVAAFERYYATALIYCGGYFFIIVQLARCGSGLFTVFAALLLCGGLICPNFGMLIPQRMRNCYEYDVRCRFDSLVADYNIPSGLTYIVFSSEHNEIIARVMCTYLLQPGTTRVCTEGETESLVDLWQAYDYYIILDESVESMDFVESVMGKSEVAGYTD